MELFKKIPDKSIDLVVTDPPYKVISGGKPHKKGQPSGMLSKNDGKIFDFNDIKPETWIPEVYRILKEDTQCYIMVNTLNLEKYLRICREVGFKLHSVLAWKKQNCTPSRWYMKNGEFTLFLRKGKAKTINNVGSKMIHEFENPIGDKDHPTEKPIDLMEMYICNSSRPGDIVCDPFIGTGNSGLAALMNNRSFVGCEIDINHFVKAKKKVEVYDEFEVIDNEIFKKSN